MKISFSFDEPVRSPATVETVEDESMLSASTTFDDAWELFPTTTTTVIKGGGEFEMMINTIIVEEPSEDSCEDDHDDIQSLILAFSKLSIKKSELPIVEESCEESVSPSESECDEDEPSTRSESELPITEFDDEEPWTYHSMSSDEPKEYFCAIKDMFDEELHELSVLFNKPLQDFDEEYEGLAEAFSKLRPPSSKLPSSLPFQAPLTKAQLHLRKARLFQFEHENKQFAGYKRVEDRELDEDDYELGPNKIQKTLLHDDDPMDIDDGPTTTVDLKKAAYMGYMARLDFLKMVFLSTMNPTMDEKKQMDTLWNETFDDSNTAIDDDQKKEVRTMILLFHSEYEAKLKEGTFQ